MIGELKAVSGTVLDFTSAHAIGERIAHFATDVSMKGGYDHNFVINRASLASAPDGATTMDPMVFAARLTEPKSGRVMEVSTTAPGTTLYLRLLVLLRYITCAFG
jgi:aldose 1-epimerase